MASPISQLNPTKTRIQPFIVILFWLLIPFLNMRITIAPIFQLSVSIPSTTGLCTQACSPIASQCSTKSGIWTWPFRSIWRWFCSLFSASNRPPSSPSSTPWVITATRQRILDDSRRWIPRSFAGTLSVFYLTSFVITKASQWGWNYDFQDTNSPSYIAFVRPTFPALSGMLSLALFLHNCVVAIMKNNRHQEKNVKQKKIHSDLLFLLLLLHYTKCWQFSDAGWQVRDLSIAYR